VMEFAWLKMNWKKSRMKSKIGIKIRKRLRALGTIQRRITTWSLLKTRVFAQFWRGFTPGDIGRSTTGSSVEIVMEISHRDRFRWKLLKSDYRRWDSHSVWRDILSLTQQCVTLTAISF
jgi:hypothetical protein